MKNPKLLLRAIFCEPVVNFAYTLCLPIQKYHQGFKKPNRIQPVWLRKPFLVYHHTENKLKEDKYPEEFVNLQESLKGDHQADNYSYMVGRGAGRTRINIKSIKSQFLYHFRLKFQFTPNYALIWIIFSHGHINNLYKNRYDTVKESIVWEYDAERGNGRSQYECNPRMQYIIIL